MRDVDAMARSALSILGGLLKSSGVSNVCGSYSLPNAADIFLADGDDKVEGARRTS